MCIFESLRISLVQFFSLLRTRMITFSKDHSVWSVSSSRCLYKTMVCFAFSCCACIKDTKAPIELLHRQFGVCKLFKMLCRHHTIIYRDVRTIIELQRFSLWVATLKNLFRFSVLSKHKPYFGSFKEPFAPLNSTSPISEPNKVRDESRAYYKLYR